MLAVGVSSLANWRSASAAGPAAFLACVILIAFFFGGCFVLFAAQASRIYGWAHFPQIYPWIFLSYGLAALSGPTIGGWLFDSRKDYTPATFIAASVCAIGAVGFALLTRSRQTSAGAEAQEKTA